MNSTRLQTQLVQFLEEELLVPSTSVAVALRRQEHPSQLPMILWQYGFITIEQLDRIFDWLEMA